MARHPPNAASRPHGTEAVLWAARRGLLFRLLADLTASELEVLRRCDALTLGRSDWSEGTRLDEAGLALDSLERLTLTARFAEFFGAPSSAADRVLGSATTLGETVDALTRPANEAEDIGFRTSGSRGPSQCCRHRLEDLLAETAAWRDMLPDARRIVAFVPSHHIYGFIWSILLPAAIKAETVDARATGFGAAFASAQPGDVLVAAPVIWAFAARAQLVFRDGVVGISSAASLPQETAVALRRRAGLRLFEIYGATETGGIGWREDSDEPYRLLDAWVRSGSGLSRRCGDSDRTIIPPDRLAWSGARRLRPIGRHDQAVQVGGHNVYPDRVANVIERHAQVAKAAVRLDRHTGRLKAFVVPVAMPADTVGFRALLIDFLKADLRPPAIPVAFSFGPALPRDPLGKLVDW